MSAITFHKRSFLKRPKYLLMGLSHRFLKAVWREPEHSDRLHRLIYVPFNMPEGFHG